MSTQASSSRPLSGIFLFQTFLHYAIFLRQEINVTTRTASFSAIWIWIFHLPAHQLNSFIFFVSFFMIDKKWIYKRLMDCLSDWLADQLAYRLAELQTDLLVINDQLTEWLCYWPTHRLADRLTDWLKYGLTELLALLLTDYLPERLSYWLTILLTDYLTDWLTDWLTDYLTDWFTARLSWWLTISATHLLKNRQILLAKWLTEWRLTNRRTDEPTQPVDWQTDGRIDDWRTDGLGPMEWQVNEWQKFYYDWPVMSDYLNRPDSLKWPITWLIHWPTDWLVGWLTQLLREGIILCLLQFS